MNSNFFFFLSKITVQVLWDIAFFPLWWYSFGLFRFLNDLRIFLKERWIIVGAGVWLKNIFTPMYGQSDIVSRLISFVIRFIQIIVRFAVFSVFLALAIVAFIIWILLPPVLLYLIFQKLF